MTEEKTEPVKAEKSLESEAPSKKKMFSNSKTKKFARELWLKTKEIALIQTGKAEDEEEALKRLRETSGWVIESYKFVKPNKLLPT